MSCSSRKVEKMEQKHLEIGIETEVKDRSTLSETMIKVIEERSQKLEELEFEIQPLDSIPASFSINYNGQILQGQTSGKLLIKKKKQETQSEAKKEEKASITSKKQSVKAQIKKQEIEQTEKKTERKSDYKGIAVGISAVLVLGIIIWSVLSSRK